MDVLTIHWWSRIWASVPHGQSTCALLEADYNIWGGGSDFVLSYINFTSTVLLFEISFRDTLIKKCYVFDK